jgi:hypothetical protein
MTWDRWAAGRCQMAQALDMLRSRPKAEERFTDLARMPD